MGDSQKDTDGYLQVTTDDLNLYFADTYLKLKRKEEKSPFWYCLIREFVSSENGPVVLFRTVHSPGLQDVPVRQLDFDFEFPQVGMYNYQKTAVFFQRKTARQNKKGFCGGTSLIQPVHEYMGHFEPGVPYDFQIRNLWKWSTSNVVRVFQKHEYTTLESGFVDISRCRAFARALSPNFFIAPGIHGTNPSLWFRRTLVGEVAAPDHIQVSNQMFYQEVVDELATKGMKINVT